MTIKNQNKNISAEIDITQLFDIEVEQDHGEITAVKLTRRDFYNDESKTTYDLMDYFYTEQEIDNFVKVHLVVYDSFSQLPQNNGISAGKSNYIYLVPYIDSEGVKEGIYKEYVWVQIKNSSKYRTNKADHNDYVLDGNHYNYESLGSTEIDLSQIRQDIANLQSGKLDKVKVIDNLTTSTYNSSDPTALSAKQGKQLQDNKIDKTSIATNLATNDDTKVLSAKQGKQLQDNKIDKTSIATNLATNDDTKVLSAKQGKNLQDNKVDKSSIVDSVTNDNINPVTSNAVFDTFSDILDQLQSTSLLLSSNHPVIQSDQSSRLIARIYGDTISNDNILFYEKKTGIADVLLDTVPTTNGVATYSYSGTGVGKKEFYAKCGSLVSETYSLFDCTFYDGGVTGNTNGGFFYPTASNFNVSTDDTGTVVENATSSVQTPRIKYANSTELQFSDVSQIEFDIEDVNGAVIVQVWKSNNTGDAVGLNITDAMSSYSLSSAHITVKTTGSRIIFLVDSYEKQNSSFSFVSSGNMSVRIAMGGNASFKYKNFKVYPI